MKKLRIAFLINPLPINKHAEDTTFAIMAECQRRNHTLYVLTSQDLLLHRATLSAEVKRVCVDAKRGVIVLSKSFVNLRKMSCVFLRKEPPFDTDYLTCTQLLDFLPKRTFVLNRAAGVRSVNEKISAHHFPDMIPNSLVGYRPELLVARIRLDRQPCVLKPVNQKGGKGIFKSTQSKALVGTLKRNFHGAPFLCQSFVPHRKEGDKRILILDGKPLGAFTRIPGRDFRANMALGAKAQRAKISSRELKLVAQLQPYLKSNGLYFTGIDVLDGKLTEINVTSPAGIPEINAFNNTCLERQVVNFIERSA